MNGIRNMEHQNKNDQGIPLTSTINSLGTLRRLTAILVKISQGPEAKEIEWLFADEGRAVIAKELLDPAIYELYRPAIQQTSQRAIPDAQLPLALPEHVDVDDAAMIKGHSRQLPKYDINLLLKKATSDLSDDEVMWLFNNPKRREHITQARNGEGIAQLKRRFLDIKERRKFTLSADK